MVFGMRERVFACTRIQTSNLSFLSPMSWLLDCMHHLLLYMAWRLCLIHYGVRDSRTMEMLFLLYLRVISPYLTIDLIAIYTLTKPQNNHLKQSQLPVFWIFFFLSTHKTLKTMLSNSTIQDKLQIFKQCVFFIIVWFFNVNSLTKRTLLENVNIVLSN